MNLQNSFFYFTEAIPRRICDDIIKYGELKDKLLGVTGDMPDRKMSNKEKNKLFKTRNSSVVFLDDPWIYSLIIPYINRANDLSGWRFQIDTPETTQWTKYSKTQHYTWHMDSFPNPYQNNEFHGKIRKLSMTLSLCDGDEYEGGDLEFDLRDKPTKSTILTSKDARKKGTITVFPSFVYHRVTPVTKGTRYSLVSWILGNPFI